jgi:hypothetical protein
MTKLATSRNMSRASCEQPTKPEHDRRKRLQLDLDSMSGAVYGQRVGRNVERLLILHISAASAWNFILQTQSFN